MGRYIAIALVAGSLFATLGRVEAGGASTWHWAGSCNGHPIGSVWYGPEKDDCGQPAIHRCFPRGARLPPPIPCNRIAPSTITTSREPRSPNRRRPSSNVCDPNLVSAYRRQVANCDNRNQLEKDRCRDAKDQAKENPDYASRAVAICASARRISKSCYDQFRPIYPPGIEHCK